MTIIDNCVIVGGHFEFLNNHIQNQHDNDTESHTDIYYKPVTAFHTFSYVWIDKAAITHFNL